MSDGRDLEIKNEESEKVTTFCTMEEKQWVRDAI